MFPVFVNLDSHLAVVVGGGLVGRRKSQTLRTAGAIVRIVDPARTEFAEPGVEWIAEPYQAKHLDGAHLVVAAATPAVNAAVVADAKACGLWVNSASDPAAGNITFPVTHVVGGLTIAVGTGGASPVLARQIRDQLREQFDAAYGEWVAVLAQVRKQVRAIPDAATRERLLTSFADWEWLERIRRDGAAVVLAEMTALASRSP